MKCQLNNFSTSIIIIFSFLLNQKAKICQIIDGLKKIIEVNNFILTN